MQEVCQTACNDAGSKHGSLPGNARVGIALNAQTSSNAILCQYAFPKWDNGRTDAVHETR